jgi:hypothetical protein
MRGAVRYTEVLRAQLHYGWLVGNFRRFINFVA